MRRIGSRNTGPELLVRKLLCRLGYRYRLHWSKLPGKPDIALTKPKKAVFVHGCFWHQHEGCKHGRLPKSRLDYWAPKLARNRARDNEVGRELVSRGWDVLVIWECELQNQNKLERKLLRFIERGSD
jgi:DNA mismatch endonuclease (patch repair protein)